MQDQERKWIYHNPEFECDPYNPMMLSASPWSGHRNLAYDLVCWLKPHRIAELGSFYGCSAFSFLQAVKDYQLDTEFYGIDIWEDFDDYTTQDYRENIYFAYQQINEKCYSKQSSHMLKMTFDKALNQFEEESIDLLHIDGSHHYENVKHDFELWKNKVTRNGIVLFHDISKEKVNGSVMGSHQYWQELKEQYPYTCEFSFSFGLGLLFFDQSTYEAFLQEVDFMYYQEQENHQSVLAKDRLRKYYFQVRDQETYIADLKSQLEIKDFHLDAYEKQNSKIQQYVKQLENRIQGLELQLQEQLGVQEAYQKNLAGKERYISELLKNQAAYEENLSGKDAYINILHQDQEKIKEDLSEKDQYIAQLLQEQEKFKENLAGKDQYIGQLLQEQEKFKENLAGKDQYIAQLLQEQKKFIDNLTGKDTYIAELIAALEAHRRTISEKDAYIAELLTVQEEYRENLSRKDAYIEDLLTVRDEYRQNLTGKELYIEELLRIQNAYQENLAGKERYITELLEIQKEYQKNLSGKDRYIDELLETQEAYRKNLSGKEQYIRELLVIQEKQNTVYLEQKNYIKELETKLDTQITRLQEIEDRIVLFQDEMNRNQLRQFIMKRIDQKRPK